jgi:hypothetical protein
MLDGQQSRQVHTSSRALGSPPALIPDQPLPPASMTAYADLRSGDPVVVVETIKTLIDDDHYLLELTWSGGTMPYSVVKSLVGPFDRTVTTLATELEANSLVIEMEISDLPAFFNVFDSSVVSPAVQGMGFDPLPAPTAPTVTPSAAWWGDTITLSASYLDPIARANVALTPFLSARGSTVNVPAGSAFADSVTMTVPADARSFPAIVSAHGRGSPVGEYVSLSPKGIGPYTDIHGVSWSPVDGTLFVAAQGIIQHFDLFTAEPWATVDYTDTSLSHPYISRVTEAGTVLVVDTTPGVTSISELTCAGGSCSMSTFASTSDDDFTRSIDPVGLAADPDGSVAYVVDAGAGRVVRIPRNAGPGSSTITDQWGGLSNRSFPDPCGVDVAEGHQVMIVDPSWGVIVQLTGPTTSEVVASADAYIHSIEVDRDISDSSTVRYTISHEVGMAGAFNLNQIDGNPPRYVGATVFGLGTGQLELAFDWTYLVHGMTPKRVLLRSMGLDVPYPSPAQTGDRVISITGEGWPGVPIQLEIMDPPDLAAYAPDDGWSGGLDPTPATAPSPPYLGNDNKASSGYYLSDGVTSPANPLVVTPGDEGLYTVQLIIPPTSSGDNFQIKVTKVDPSGTVLNERVGAWSTVLTAWKRVYVERAKMFRRGGVLVSPYGPREPGCGDMGEPECPFCGHDDYPPCCGLNEELPCDQIEVYDWSDVAVGDTVVVFDEFNTYPDCAERRLVTGMQPSTNLYAQLITLDTPLHNHYRNSLIDNATKEPTFRNYNSAGIGVLSSCDQASNQLNAPDSCFYDADMRGIERPFNDAFMEVVALRDGMSTVPYLPESFFSESTEVTDYQHSLSRTWFSHWSVDPGDELRCAPNNYFHLLGASEGFERAGLARVNANTSVVLVQSIIDRPPPPGAPFNHFVQTVSNHEIAHQFDVNPCACDLHDRRDSWCEALGDCGVSGLPHPVHCIMNITDDIDANRTDGVDRFCAQDLLHGSPGCSGFQCEPDDIRTFDAGHGAIRTMPEPR